MDNQQQKGIDAKLIEDYLLGDKKALALLVKRWHLEFCRKALWIVKDTDLAKDIAQDSWQVIIDKIETLKDANSFKSWAMRIVYTKSLDELRRISKERINKEEVKQEQKIENDELIQESIVLKIALKKAINRLPLNQQHVIKLFYVESYSLKEIAAILKISLGTTKSRMFHAREKLKEQLKKTNYEN